MLRVSGVIGSFVCAWRNDVKIVKKINEKKKILIA